MDEPEVVEIPINLEECFVALNKILPPETIEQIKTDKIEPEEGMTEEHALGLFHHWLHMGLGMHLRNTWRLWYESPLVEWFNAHDVWHADDMSGIIIDSYKKRLNGQPIDLESQVKHYNNYWKNKKVDIKAETLAARKK